MTAGIDGAGILTGGAQGGVTGKVTARIDGVELVVCAEDIRQLDCGRAECQVAVSPARSVSADGVACSAGVGGSEEVARVANTSVKLERQR